MLLFPYVLLTHQTPLKRPRTGSRTPTSDRPSKRLKKTETVAGVTYPHVFTCPLTIAATTPKSTARRRGVRSVMSAPTATLPLSALQPTGTIDPFTGGMLENLDPPATQSRRSSRHRVKPLAWWSGQNVSPSSSFSSCLTLSAACLQWTGGDHAHFTVSNETSEVSGP